MRVRHIHPIRPTMLHNLRELREYRGLFGYFAQRAMQNRYKETILGPFWLLIRPLAAALMFTLVFGKIVRLPSDGQPYLLFFFSGFLVWSYFQNSLVYVTRSLRTNRRLITRMYFPNIIVPLSYLAPFVLELLINLILLSAIFFYYFNTHSLLYSPNITGLLWAALCLFLTTLFAMGIGLWTTVLNAQARDVRFSMSYIMRFWFFATPVIYPVSLIPSEWRWAMVLNPMLPLVDGFRAGVTGGVGPEWSLMLSAICVVCLTLLCGLWFFSKAEALIADIL
jgi:lipopolysaccharide transport system permease protein